MIPHHVCARRGFDLRGAAKISVKAPARRLERSIDDICKGSPTIQEWVARLLRIPNLVGLGSDRPLANLPTSARIRRFEQLSHKADDGGVVDAARAVPRRCRMAPAAGGRDGLIARFVDIVDERQGSPQFTRALQRPADLAALLSAYARAIGERSKPRGGDPGRRKRLAA